MKQRFAFWLSCFAVASIFCGCFCWKQSSRPRQLTISFQTTSTDGRFSPRNVHSVWVETADGAFIKTLGLWGGSKRIKNLTQWKTAAVDIESEIVARTGATQHAYGSYTCVWDLTDADGKIVPDGDYNIRFELTSDNANKNNYHRATIPFKKTNALGTTTPIEQDGYTNIVLDYQLVPTTE